MKAKLTLSLLGGLETTGSTYEVHDTTVSGLFVRVTAAGHKSYVVRWARGKKKTLGRVGVLTLDRARKEALQYLAEAHEHGEPLAVSQARAGASMPTLEAFLVEQFEPWARVHHRDHVNSVRAIRSAFADLLPLKLEEIDHRRVERLRVSWVDGGNTPATANRNIQRIKGLLSRAVEWGVLAEHPLAKLRRLKTDRRGRIRYLTTEELADLRQAMDTREEGIRAERDSANLWRKERNKELMQDLREVTFADHLKPLVLLSINTGMRRGEVFNLQWADINFKGKVLTVEGETSKSGQTRHIPLNKEALEVLQCWRDQHTRKAGYVFPGKEGGRLDNVKKSWDGLLKLAKIEGFRWHDLRHTFASKLVMAGVPLNTVRELLGHSDIAMTLRYAHLAPDSKAAAVELI
ncbi:site-specific integrase [Pseudomonas asiatica]|uniref:site-specific integrase n=1 Tax=Pseudomonas asiatica TaxID=2219225 RepID=UPI001E4A1C13|nr:site-specific integrase [Pseudomonas asiatica]MCE1098385.1 site-specific integrase [Pseudomonas asiatica]MCE1104071.1 site-specific integrase [Pseudomonas asiatica]WJR23057.1 site-specific integrase [Pseudomonas asiatica]